MVKETYQIIIDGTLKQNISIMNDLSAFSYKSRIKGVEDIFILYAYDLELMEPVASGVFLANSIVSVSDNEFVISSGINKGIIVENIGFTEGKIQDILKANPELHYLTPIKRSDSRIASYGLLNFDSVVRSVKENVLSRKVKVSERHYLYSYQDSWTEYREKKSAEKERFRTKVLNELQ